MDSLERADAGLHTILVAIQCSTVTQWLGSRPSLSCTKNQSGIRRFVAFGEVSRAKWLSARDQGALCKGYRVPFPWWHDHSFGSILRCTLVIGRCSSEGLVCSVSSTPLKDHHLPTGPEKQSIPIWCRSYLGASSFPQKCPFGFPSEPPTSNRKRAAHLSVAQKTKRYQNGLPW